MFVLCRRQLLFFIDKKSNQKSLVQKKAIAKHRSFSNQNAFSIAHGEDFFFVVFKCDRRTFDSSLTIACFLNGPSIKAKVKDLTQNYYSVKF